MNPFPEPQTVGTRLTWRDRMRHWGYRWGIGRMSAAVAPGLYRVGNPGGASPVLISANYRMSFDRLRAVLGGRDAWILTLDTRGINVWCAAGKGTFGTQELVNRLALHRLSDIVQHRKLILPQLGAPGVAAHEVKKASGFTVRYGPVRAQDLPAYLDSGQATPEMRRVTFTLRERLAVVPIEMIPAFLPVLAIAAGIALAGGWQAGTAFLAVGLSAPLAVPVLHDWLPGTWLSLKGAVWGFLGSWAVIFVFKVPALPAAALILSAAAVSSYLALNFTGATPYTSVNGVKREMRRMLPMIISAAGIGLAGWIFLGIRRLLS